MTIGQILQKYAQGGYGTNFNQAIAEIQAILAQSGEYGPERARSTAVNIMVAQGYITPEQANVLKREAHPGVPDTTEVYELGSGGSGPSTFADYLAPEARDIGAEFGTLPAFRAQYGLTGDRLNPAESYQASLYNPLAAGYNIAGRFGVATAGGQGELPPPITWLDYLPENAKTAGRPYVFGSA
jgi:hypothetical protein